MSSCAIDPQWGKSGFSLYNSNELTFLLRRITPICVVSASVSAISQTPWNTAWCFASKLTWCSGTLSKSCLTGSNWYSCILVGHSGKVSVSSSETELAILQRLPSDVVGIWSRDLGIMATLSVWQKMPFFSCIYNPHSFTYIIVFYASFNGNCVKNHPNLGLVL